MLNKKEIISIIIVTLILAFAISLLKTFEIFLFAILSIFLVIMINIVAKKIASFHLDSKIEIKLWEIKQYWFKAHQHFKKPFPAGAFFPIITTALSLGYVIWMACLSFDVKPRTHRAAKRYGLYTFSEMTELHTGLIATAGIIANLMFAIIGYLINFPEFAKLNIYYAVFNMLPISDLDGNKIFFGNLILWSFLASITLIGLFFAIFIV